MTSESKKKEQFEAEKSRRLETAKTKLLDGTIGAISIDTCIFTTNDYGLDKGVLKHLEQFKGNTFELIFSEITIKEVRGHIAKRCDEAKVKLRSALRGIGKYWQEHAGQESLVIDNLLGTEPIKDLTSNKLKDFITRCGASLVKTKTELDIDELLKMYFDLQPPFEFSADKKSEFPDAMALLSLQSWAIKHHKAVLFVTNDHGCIRFCERSDHLYPIDSLTNALSLIQQRNEHLSILCNTLESLISSGKYPDLINLIEIAISDDIWSIDWMLEADSYHYYEAELEEIDLASTAFAGPDWRPKFSVVDYRDDMLVVQVTMQIELDTLCNFNFSVKDGFDHDMVHIGDSSVRSKQSVNVDVLLTFENPNVENPEIVEIELVYCRRTLDFGSVEPDYGDEDPNSEYY